MPGLTTASPTDTEYNGALGYIREKVADFRRLGTVELPALRKQVTAIWLSAAKAGDTDLATRAQGKFDEITAAQAEWEQHNDTLQSIIGPLDKVGIHLGVIPVAVWVAVAVVGLATAIAGLMLLRDRVAASVSQMCVEAVQKGVMSADQCASIVSATKPKGPFEGIGSGLFLLGAGYLAVLYFTQRKG